MGNSKLEARKKKKVALVDIDGCLLIKGELNLNLVKRLREGGYDEIILFTQRSKFVQSLNLPMLTDDTLKSTADAVASLSAALEGKPIKVSTSVDSMFGEQFAYFDQLKSFEELVLANASIKTKLRFHQAKVLEIETLKRKLETASEPEISQLNEQIRELETFLLPKEELEEINRKTVALEQEIEKEKAAIAQYQIDHPEYKTTDPEGYPVNKQQQLKDVRAKLTQDGSELEEDYFDDNYLNLFEFEEVENKLNRFMVSENRILSFEQVGPNFDSINEEIAKLRTEYEQLINEKLDLDLSNALTLDYKQLKVLNEPAKTAVTNLQRLNTIQASIEKDSERSLGKGLDTAELYMSTRAYINVPTIKEELKKINNLIQFNEAPEEAKAEIAKLKTEYERVIKKKLGIDPSTALAMKPEQIQELQKPHKTAVTNLQNLVKLQNGVETDAAAFYLAKEPYQNVHDLKEELKKIYIKTVYSPANLEKPREHEYEVTPNTVENVSEAFKERYNKMRGDELKTHILLNFKSEIEKFNTVEEIQAYMDAFKDTDEYKTLETGQGGFTRAAHKMGLKKLITTDSVDALNKIVKDAKKEIEERGVELPKMQ